MAAVPLFRDTNMTAVTSREVKIPWTNCIHTWQLFNYSLISMLIILTCPVSSNEIQENFCFKMRLVRMISTKTKEYFIGHFGDTIILFLCPPKFCISILFVFSWGHCKSQEKLENNAYAKFEGTNKEYYGIFRSDLLAAIVCARKYEMVRMT